MAAELNTRSLLAAIRYDDTPLTDIRNSYRSCPPEETLERVSPHLLRFGITRVGNITGLDRVGVPVWIAIRPNARSLSLSQGKGLTHDGARASAVCEAIETFYAERCTNSVRMARYASPDPDMRLVDVSRLPQARHGLFRQSEAIPWVESSDLTTGENLWVPYELVHADATVPRLPGSGCFVFSSNGLASGNTAGEAVFHGLCELIERDAIALWKLRSAEAQSGTRVRNSSVDDSGCMRLIRQLDEADIDTLIWDVTSDLNVPTFRVLLFDRWSHSELTYLPVAFGAGCHPNRAVALTRAITEAAQSRLTTIAGSRDDLTRSSYLQAEMPPEVAFEYAQLARENGQRQWNRISNHDFTTLSEGVRWLLSGLQQAGIDQVCLVQISPASAPLTVVRTIAPGLEGPSSSPSWTPGTRARRMLN